MFCGGFYIVIKMGKKDNRPDSLKPIWQANKRPKLCLTKDQQSHNETLIIESIIQGLRMINERKYMPRFNEHYFRLSFPTLFMKTLAQEQPDHYRNRLTYDFLTVAHVGLILMFRRGFAVKIEKTVFNYNFYVHGNRFFGPSAFKSNSNSSTSLD